MGVFRGRAFTARESRRLEIERRIAVGLAVSRPGVRGGGSGRWCEICGNLICAASDAVLDAVVALSSSRLYLKKKEKDERSDEARIIAEWQERKEINAKPGEGGQKQEKKGTEGTFPRRMNGVGRGRLPQIATASAKM